MNRWLGVIGGLLLLVSCGDGQSIDNHDPVITDLVASNTNISVREQVNLTALVSDVDGDTLTSEWSATAGTFQSTDLTTATWQAPDTAATAIITLLVRDGKGGRSTGALTINVSNAPPVISRLTAVPRAVFVSNTVRLSVTATDPDGGALSYRWRTIPNVGRFLGTPRDSATWVAPDIPQSVDIRVTVTDPLGAADSMSVEVNVSGEVGSVWISDTFNNRVVKMSGDGNVLSSLGGFSSPRGIAINPVERHIWVVDFGNNQVKKLNSNGTVIVRVDSLFEPRAVAVWDFDGSAWITQSTDSTQVIHVDALGRRIARYDGFLSPRGIAVDQRNGDVWISDTGRNRVIRLERGAPNRYNVNGAELRHRVVTGYQQPWTLAVDDVGRCWIADRLNNRVVRLDANAANPFVIRGLKEPQGLAVNPRTGELWVCDTGANQVLVFDPELFGVVASYNISTDAGFHKRALGFSMPILQPFAVSVNEETGNAWFSEESRVIKLNRSPLVVKEVTGFVTPRALQVNSGL